MSKARDVNALFMAMSMLPIQAPSMRSKATRFAPASTTAMFIGTPISAAFFSPLRMTSRACSSVTPSALPVVSATLSSSRISMRTFSGDLHDGTLGEATAYDATCKEELPSKKASPTGGIGVRPGANSGVPALFQTGNVMILDRERVYGESGDPVQRQDRSQSNRSVYRAS